MRFAISNIAWAPEVDADVARAMRAHGAEGVELAPTKYFPDLGTVTERDALELRARWEALGFPVVATQSLLFGRPELQVFGDAELRARTQDALRRVLRIGAWLGAKAQVFGSPKNRLRGPLPWEEALARAAEFFRPLGDYAASLGTCLVVEPNPPAYGCDFVTRAAEGAELVRRVDSAGFRLHLDAAGMLLAGDDGPACAAAFAPLLAHFHFSAPQLGPVVASAGVDYAGLAAALRSAAYPGWISIEMRQGEGNGLAAAEDTLRFVRGLLR